MNPTASVTCQETLENIRAALEPVIKDMVLGDTFVMQVGIYKDIRKLAVASGMDRSTAIQAIALVSRVLEANRGKDTVLGSTLKYLQRHQKHERSLLVCVLSGTCHLPVGTMFIPDESRIALGRVNPTLVHVPLDRPIPHLILMNGGQSPYAWDGIPGPPQAVAIAWAIDFLSAATSFADYELISDWIQANAALLQAGRRSDELFDRYARIVPAIRIDAGFYRVLSSSHATVASLAVLPINEVGVREEAMNEIKADWRATGPVVTRHGLSAENIVQFGERVTREMMDTIRRAEAL
jgi:hypothetical protein